MPPSIINKDQTSITLSQVTLENVDFALEDVHSLLYNITGESATGLAKSLVLKFQSELNQGVISNEWKNLTVFPIFPKVDEFFHEEPRLSKCRQISLTSVDFKVFERILTNKIVDHLEINQLLSKHHCGLDLNQSCFTDDMDFFEKDYPLDIIQLHWMNAFETIPHNHLIAKLKEFGISGKVLEWIEGFLKDQTRRVKLDGELSDPLLITSGVPRESILGRILFLIYINDIFDGIQSEGKIYTDYCTLFRTIKSPSDRDILQQDLLQVKQWSSKWSIKLCHSKCNVHNLGFSNPKYDYYMNKLQLHNCTKEEDSIDLVPPHCKSSNNNRIAGEPIYHDRAVADKKTNFSNLCKVYDHVFSKNTKFPVFESDPNMNIRVTDLVSFGDLEDAGENSEEKIPVGGTICGTIHTVRQFHPGVYRCTRVIPFEDHEPLFIYHHENIDPAKIIKQAFLMMKDFNEYHCDMINYINRYDWTHASSWGVGSSEESEDDENDEQRLNKWLKKKRMIHDKELYKNRKRYMYFARYENASYLKDCVKNECIEYSDFSNSHYTVLSPQLKCPIAMAADIPCSIEPWKLGKAFQDISSEKDFALLIHNYNMFMYDIEEYGFHGSIGRLSKRYPNMKFTSITETELKFNMGDFKF